MSQRRIGMNGRGVAAVLLLALLAGISLSLVIRAPGAVTQAAGAAQVRLGVDSFILGAQIHVAAERGLFKKYGIDPVVQVFSYGADTLDAVLAGRSDFGVGMDFATLTRLAPGQLRLVATIMEPDPGFHKLAVSSAINDPKDLRGKRLGVAQGSLQEYVTLRYLEVNGIPEDSVKLTPFSSLFEIIAALRAGRIDAAWVWGEGTDQAKEIPGVRILTDDSAARQQSLGFLVASRQLVEKNPQVVVATLKALAEATDWMLSNMNEASKIVADKVKAPQEQVLTEMRRENYTLSLKDEQLKAMESLAQFMVNKGIIKEKLSVRQNVAPDALRSVDPARVSLK
ncbi:MAG TPA: ABC transporter substrate-binding protein [Firmicutes bacterium]|nr:ABC transporter substrate-binding protein [Bacillota bacterium]